MNNLHRIFGSIMGALMLLSVVLLQPSFVSAHPDADTIPELNMDGPSTVAKGATLSQTVQVDDDMTNGTASGKNLVAGVKFTLTIPQICKDNATDMNRGVTVTIDPAWNAISSFNVAVSGANDHAITVVAAAKDNVDTSAGKNVATIVCETDAAVTTTVTDGFSDIQVSKRNPIQSLTGVQGVGNQVTVVVGKGDLNGDGKTTVGDLIILADGLSGRAPLSPANQIRADVFPAKSGGAGTCGDKVVDLNDLLALIDLALARTNITAQCG